MRGASEQTAPEPTPSIHKEAMTSTSALPTIGSRNDPSVENRFNWRIAPVLILFHVGALAALFFFMDWAVRRALFILGDRRPGARHVLSPAAHSSLLRDTQVV